VTIFKLSHTVFDLQAPSTDPPRSLRPGKGHARADAARARGSSSSARAHNSQPAIRVGKHNPEPTILGGPGPQFAAVGKPTTLTDSLITMARRRTYAAADSLILLESFRSPSADNADRLAHHYGPARIGSVAASVAASLEPQGYPADGPQRPRRAHSETGAFVRLAGRL
jgi:hypothetical protein